MFDDVFDSEYPRDAKIYNFDYILFLRVEDYILKFQICMLDSFSMAMSEDIEHLKHYMGGPFLTYVTLSFEHWGQTLTVAEFHDNEELVAVFEEFVDFIDVGMIDFFEPIDLILKKLSFLGPEFVFIDNVHWPDKFCLSVNDFS